jgi:hypothetical protein
MDLLTGGHGNADPNSTLRKKPFFETKYTGAKHAFLERIRKIPYSQETQDDFFCEVDLVRKIQLTSRILIRLG